jgi:hypothetical protein
MNPEFQSHRLSPEGINKVERVKHMFNYLLESLTCINCTEHQVSIPQGRYLSIVKTKLEEACMFAVKAVSCDPANQMPVLPVENFAACHGPTTPKDESK